MLPRGIEVLSRHRHSAKESNARLGLISNLPARLLLRPFASTLLHYALCCARSSRASPTGTRLPHWAYRTVRPALRSLRHRSFFLPQTPHVQSLGYCSSSTHDEESLPPGSPAVAHRSVPDLVRRQPRCLQGIADLRSHTPDEGPQRYYFSPRFPDVRDAEGAIEPESPRPDRRRSYLPDGPVAVELPFGLANGGSHHTISYRPVGHCERPVPPIPPSKGLAALQGDPHRNE